MHKKKLHQLIWFIAMILFTFTAGEEDLSILIGEWNDLIYRVYYVLAAIQGTFIGGGVLYLFGARNAINEKNVYEIFLLFGLTWLFFSVLFAVIHDIFWLVVVHPFSW